MSPRVSKMEDVKVKIVDMHQILYYNSESETSDDDAEEVNFGELIVKPDESSCDNTNHHEGMSPSEDQLGAGNNENLGWDAEELNFGELILKTEPLDEHVSAQDNEMESEKDTEVENELIVKAEAQDDSTEERPRTGRRKRQPPKMEPGIKRTITITFDMLHKRKLGQFDNFYSYQCDQCINTDGKPTPLPGYYEFRNHLKAVHKKEKRTPYAYCCETRIAAKNFYSHARKYHAPEDGEINCPECDLICDNKAALAKHKAEDHKPSRLELPRCSECDQDFITSEELKNHQEIAHSDTEPCPTCGKHIHRKHLDRHQRSHTAGEFECVLCNKFFRTKLMLTEHESSSQHKETLKFKINGKREKNRIIPGTHYDQHFNYRCESCFEDDGMVKMLSNFKEMTAHFKSVHNTNGYAFCCGRKISFAKMRGHLLHHQHPEREFKCSECNKSFESRKILSSHIANKKKLALKKLHGHSGPEKSKMCLKCNMKFDSVVDYRQHYNNSPAHNPTTICELCGKILKNSSLRTHMEMRHFQEKTPCSECGKVFPSANSAYMHYQVAHKHKDTIYSCKFCDFKSRHSCDVHSHTRRKHGKNAGGTPYVRPLINCVICGKNFSSKNTLKDHMMIHTGARDYACEFCDATFTAATYFYKHRKEKHPAEYAKWKAASKGLEQV